MWAAFESLLQCVWNSAAELIIVTIVFKLFWGEGVLPVVSGYDVLVLTFKIL